MSVQFGTGNFDGRPVDPEYLARAQELLARYGPDGCASYSENGASILYCAFHTTKESRQERQPIHLASGAALTWDGRLDNRAEFIGLLCGLSADSPDAVIVAAAYERWGAHCFARLAGDWALAIWNPQDRFLILAKDATGTRHLYYCSEPERVTWSTILDPLVLLTAKTFALEEEYIAGWLGMFPATRLTPYAGILSVPPACFVRLAKGRKAVTKYWDFDPGKRISYRRDPDYEEHFRWVFREAVRRRLRSDSPVVAELSGGMDSSSIVCMADAIIAEGVTETPRLDTLSYYDDSEPNWNERPYFTKVEEQRGRAGCRVDIARRDECELSRNFSALPGSRRPSEIIKQIACYLESLGARVVLSGRGGDEFLGGVPAPAPELADLLAGARWGLLARQLKRWALQKRKPWWYLAWETTRAFLPAPLVSLPESRGAQNWLTPRFAKRNRTALMGYRTRWRFFGPRPSFQENVSTVETLRRQISCLPAMCDPLSEARYPYLDRDLLEFLFAIPREQLVRPGERRSLMRRALGAIVPEEILNRKRKAFATRTPVVAALANWTKLLHADACVALRLLGVVNESAFSQAIGKARFGQGVPIVPLARAVEIETWLRTLRSLQPLAMGSKQRAAERDAPLGVEGEKLLS